MKCKWNIPWIWLISEGGRGPLVGAVGDPLAMLFWSTPASALQWFIYLIGMNWKILFLSLLLPLIYTLCFTPVDMHTFCFTAYLFFTKEEGETRSSALFQSGQRSPLRPTRYRLVDTSMRMSQMSDAHLFSLNLFRVMAGLKQISDRLHKLIKTKPTKYQFYQMTKLIRCYIFHVLFSNSLGFTHFSTASHVVSARPREVVRVMDCLCRFGFFCAKE